MQIVKIFNDFLDIVFPRNCCICGLLLKDENLKFLCNFCANKIIYINGNTCNKCGYDFGETSVNNIKKCPRCDLQNFEFESLKSAVHINKITRQLIHLLKYKDNEYLSDDIAKIILKNNEFKSFIFDSILVPVPLHWMRIFRREYNQSELIARSLEKFYPNISVENLLKRIRNTTPQVNLQMSKRKLNLHQAFKMNNKKYISLDSKIIVFDDVFTTGTTINECCKILKENGYKNIFAATFMQTTKK